jgi:PPOX class probable F420-dependent enzyme
VKLTDDDARARLAAQGHGVLATLHEVRGADAVPCAYALVGDLVGIPVDTVKPKASQRLQRERNLDADPRATLLADHWDGDDWSRLWWVRAELRRVTDPSADDVEALTARLAEQFAQYRDRPFTGLLVLRVVGLTGWSAADL